MDDLPEVKRRLDSWIEIKTAWKLQGIPSGQNHMDVIGFIRLECDGLARNGVFLPNIDSDGKNQTRVIEGERVTKSYWGGHGQFRRRL
jgi:hypothetical protein